MNPTIANVLKQLIPTLGVGVLALVAYYFKLLRDRQHYAKQSDNHVYIFTLPKAGKLRDVLVPIENEGGVSLVRVPNSKGEVDEHSPTHILGEDGEFPVDYPLNKIKFVQTTVSGLIYYEGDAEPLSNVTNRPIVSAQLVTNLVDGVSTSSAEAMRKSLEDSAGKKLRRPSGIIWLYLLIIVVCALVVAGLVIDIRVADAINQLTTLLKQSMGVQ